MIWVDREVEKIKERAKPLEWVDDMKTPSGPIHVGSLRGVVIHDMAYKALFEAGVKAKYSYVFDDHDPMDGMPSTLKPAQWEKYMGVQLYKVPSPVKGFDSFARYYAQQFRDVFEGINCHPEIIWASELYNSGRMNDVIKKILDKATQVREIYNRMFEKKKKDDWFPFQVNCEKCGKIGTTYVYAWDGKEVSYRCEPEMVKWAKGCGHEGKISPYDGNGKLNWRVDWPAKWKVIGVTVEGAGKDHMSAGGSYDMAVAICKEILDYPPTYPLAYEFFNIGGKKMSSSKGLGVTATDIYKMLPPEVVRFLIVRTPIHTAIDFNPYGDTIPNLFDDYDRCLSAHFDKREGKLPEGKPGEVLADFARIAELSQVRPLPEVRLFLPRFRTLVNLIRTSGDLLAHAQGQKGASLSAEEKLLLEERELYAQKYLKEYAKTEISEKAQSDSPKFSLNAGQKKFLQSVSEKLESLGKTSDKETIQNSVFEVMKKEGVTAKDAFPALYFSLTGATSGPKVGDLILSNGISNAVNLLKTASK